MAHPLMLDLIKREMYACRRAAREQGWTGADEEYEYTREDLDAVTLALGRKPTREEWRAAGLRWVGEAHVAD